MGRDRGWSKSGMKKCPVCGREFWCYDLDAWAYRAWKDKKSKGPQLCSWHCQVEFNRALEEKSKKSPRKTAVKPGGREGNTQEFCWTGNLMQIMEERGVRVCEIADAAGISQSTVSCYRMCDGRCRREIAEKIADFLQVDPDDIITAGPFVTKKRKAPGE